MRVAFVVHQYLPDHVGGTELYVAGLARRAQADGASVVVFTYRDTPSNQPGDFTTRHREHDGVDVVELTYNLGVADNIARTEYDNPVATAWFREQVSGWGPDVVHVAHAMKLGVGILDVCDELALPTVVTLTDFWFLCPRHTLLTWDGALCAGPRDPKACMRCVRDLHGVRGRRRERAAVRARPSRTHAALARADRVVALAPFLVRMFAANGYGDVDFEVVPHGLELDAVGEARAEAPTAREGRCRFVFIGSIVPFKGLHIVLDALAGAPGLDVELRVWGDAAGDDRYRTEIRRCADADPRIELAGSFPPDELGRVLRAADSLVVPALWYENEPMVVKAALHLGVPVLASSLGSLVDMVRDGIDGMLVPPADVPAWGRALEDAVQRRGSWADAGRPQPSMDETYSRMAELYHEVAAGR